MTVVEYKKKFIELYEQMANEHGKVKSVSLQDTTEYHKSQMSINSNLRWISCEIIF